MKHETSRRQQPARALRAEASAWIAKLHGPERSAELEDDFREWLKADAEHASAFEQVTEIWDALGNVNVGGLPRLASADELEPRSPWMRMGIVAAACALLAVAIGAWMLTRNVYATDVGEQRIVLLEDGTRLYLNSDTKLKVDLEKHSRRIELQRGEAFFEVAKDRTRPFIVAAGDRTVTALGTSFVVRYEPGRTAVTLVEGRVALAGREPEGRDKSAALAVITLTPGQRATFEHSGAVSVDVPRSDATAAWRRGEVVLDETPLESAIVEMNRYQRQRLTLDDHEIGTLPISGIYRTGNNQDFAQAVAAVYDLEVVHVGEEIHLRRK
jgi:transmembrane sensor